MANYEIDVNGNDKVIHITSYNLRWVKPYGKDSEELYFAYDVDTALPSTILNLQSVGYSLPVLPSGIFEYVFNFMNNDYKPAEYYATDYYSEQLELFNNCAYWIWGDSENCGLVLFREDVNNFRLALIQGFYQNKENENEYIYALNQVSLNYNQLRGLFFTCNENTMREYLTNGMAALMINIDNFDDYYIYEYDPLSGYVPAAELPSHSYNYCYSQNETFHDLLDITNPIPKYVIRPHLTEILYPLFDISRHNKIGGDPYGNSELDITNPFIDGGISDPGGGGGEYPSQSDDIGFTDVSQLTIDAVTSGFLTLYNPTAQQIKDFNAFLLTGLTDNVVANLKKLQASPMEFLLFIAQCHFNPPTSVTEEISFAGIGSGVNSQVITRQYTTINCGSLVLPEATKSFLDYEGSKASIYLPYIGVRELDVKEVTNSEITVKYQINMLNGDCLAQVRLDRSARRSGDTNINAVLYHFTGNCYTTLPLSATDWRGAVGAAMSLIGAGISIAQSNSAGAIGSVADAVTSKKVSVSHGGSSSSSFGYMDNQKPYLILERPIPNIPARYGSLQGYTSNIYKKLNSLKGFTTVLDDSLWTNNINCSEEEANEIRRIFATGVYL